MALQAIWSGLAAAAEARGRIDRTLPGYITAHSSTCIPPIEPPTTASQRPIPRRSASRAWTLTMSRTVTVGNRDP